MQKHTMSPGEDALVSPSLAYRDPGSRVKAINTACALLRPTDIGMPLEG